MADTKKAKDDGLTEEEKRRKNIGSGVGGVLAMLPTIAGAIPSLKKSGQRGALERMQRGGGAGATAARQAGAAAGRATAGNLGGRGSSGLVREGIRSAERQTAEGVRAAGLIGAQEGQRGTALLLQNERLRRQAGLQLGAGLGGAAAAGIATGLAGRDQGPGMEQAPVGGDLASALAGGPAGSAARATGLGNAAAGVAQTTTQEAGQFGLDRITAARQQALPAGPPMPEQAAGAAPAAQEQPQAGPETSSVLQTMISPEEGFEQAATAYRANTLRKKDRPLAGSTGGSDDQYLQQDLMRYEEYLMGLIEQGMIDPAMVPQLMQQYVADRGGL